MLTAYTTAMHAFSGLLPCPRRIRNAAKQAAYQFSANLPAHEEQQAAIIANAPVPPPCFPARSLVLFFYEAVSAFL